MAFETWGTFSVADHLGPQAFVADVLLYDRLVLPVPDAKERDRWIRIGRQPDVLDRKLAILEEPSRRDRSKPSLVERVAWTEGFRRYLDRRYEDERTAAREGMLHMEEGEAIDRAIVAHWRRSGDPDTPEIVPAYTSYEAMETDWKPVPVPAQRVTRPGDRLVGVIGWEFFIPADPALSDDDLLAEAVRLTQRKQFRKKRSDFHRWRKEVTRTGASPQQFRRELDNLLAQYKEETAKVAVRTAVMNAFVILGASASLVGALAVPPVALAAPRLCSHVSALRNCGAHQTIPRPRQWRCSMMLVSTLDGPSPPSARHCELPPRSWPCPGTLREMAVTCNNSFVNTA